MITVRQPKRILMQLLVTAASAGALLTASMAQASLIGDVFIANVYDLWELWGSNTETAQEGPEATGHWWATFGYNVEASTISVYSLLGPPPPPVNRYWNDGCSFEFLDLDWVGSPDAIIIAVQVISATGEGWSDIGDSDVSFTDHSVTIDASDIAGVPTLLDQSVTVQVTFQIPAPGDLNSDGAVNVQDFLLLLEGWGACADPCPPHCTGDLDGNCSVDVNDFLILLANWG